MLAVCLAKAGRRLAVMPQFVAVATLWKAAVMRCHLPLGVLRHAAVAVLVAVEKAQRLQLLAAIRLREAVVMRHRSESLINEVSRQRVIAVAS